MLRYIRVPILSEIKVEPPKRYLLYQRFFGFMEYLFTMNRGEVN